VEPVTAFTRAVQLRDLALFADDVIEARRGFLFAESVAMRTGSQAAHLDADGLGRRACHVAWQAMLYVRIQVREARK
jgi:hypothetical protein